MEQINLKLLVSTSTEEVIQYKDGNGNDFAEQQMKKNVPNAPNPINIYKKQRHLRKKLLTKVNLT